ncbi:MAG TPA: T9SS type A sorting domain-containing protein [Bacteroidia bacterium]|nr:T9SS type A sorting domain-containing protein [Bacteroidia bacterium]
MKLNLIVCFIVLNVNLPAQVTVDWYNYPGGIAVATNNHDDVYTVNWDYNPAGDITLTKRDSSGSVLWDTAYNNTDNSRHEVATWVETDNAGNILVSGTIRSGFSSPVDAASLLMKFDSSGALLWRVVYENSFDGSSTKKVLVDANNNIYVLGLGTGPLGMVTKVKKFDSTGIPVWSYFDTSGIGAPLNIKFTPDSNILIVSRGATGIVNGFSKIDLNGNTIWSIAGINSSTIGDAAGDAFGNTYLINGEYVISNSGSVIQKLSPNGSQIWADTNRITAFRVEVGNDNHPVICGFPNSGTAGAAFIKYDSAGNVLWQNLDADGPAYALLLHAQMRMDPDNAAYLAAGTLNQMALCKVNSNGTSEWTVTIPGSYANAFDFQSADALYIVGGTTAKLRQSITTTVAQQEYASTVNEINLFPNPFQSLSTLEFNLSEINTVSISIVDAVGRTLKCISTTELEPGKNKIAMDLSELKSGIYFGILKTNENMQILKLIKN